MTGSVSEQLGVVDSFLSCNPTLSKRENRDYRYAVGDLVHTLLRTNPKKRRHEKVLEYLREIEDLTPPMDDQPSTKNDHQAASTRRKAKTGGRTKRKRVSKIVRSVFVRRQWKPTLKKIRSLFNH